MGRLLRMLNEHRVEIQINIIFGLDDDTPDVFDATLDFLLENRVSTIYAPEPGTTLYKRLQAEGRLLHALSRAGGPDETEKCAARPGEYRRKPQVVTGEFA